MQSLTLQTHVGKDGILKLEAPLKKISDTDVEVILVVNPLKKRSKAKTADKNQAWAEFANRFAGSMPDLPLREPQGEYEVRDELP